MYKLEFSDDSYMVVNEDFNIVLFEKKSLKPYKQVTIRDYISNINAYRDFTVCDRVNGQLIPLTLTITEVDYDGILNQRVKNVEDIKEEDIILGPDGTPREILELHSGEDEMYEIKSTDGNIHIVNKWHILPLYDIETKQILNMPLSLYIALDNESKSKLKLIKIT